MLVEERPTFLFADLLSGTLTCCASVKSDGNMSLCYGDNADSLDNRLRFLSSYRINTHDLVCAQQVHKDTVALVTKSDRGKGAVSPDNAIAGTDALITCEKRLPLGLFSADCQVIFLYDTAHHAIGIVHAGWKGTQERIAVKTLKAMHEAFGTHPVFVYAGLGPSIGKCCYQVSEDFKEYFREDVEDRISGSYFDLKKANIRQLIAAGINQMNIFASNECTCCNADTFFSYRKEGASCGRMMSVLMLR